MCTATFRYRLVVLSIVLSIVISSEARSSFRNLTEAEILNEAILLNDRDHVEVLLREGIDPNTILKDDNPALVVASVKQHNSIVNLFIQAGANVNLANKNTGITALMAASTNCVQNTSAAKILLKAGANIDARDENGWTALMIAVSRSCIIVSKFLLRRGADPNVQNNDGFTALSIACAQGFSHHVRLLLSCHADPNIPNKRGRNPLMLAVTGERRDEVTIGNESPALDETENSSLDDLSTNNEFVHIVKRLCQNGANINYQDKEGWTALMLASYFGKDTIAEVLLAAGADAELKNKDGFTALMLARQHNHISVESTLLAGKLKLFSRILIVGVIICVSLWCSVNFVGQLQSAGNGVLIHWRDLDIARVPNKITKFSNLYDARYLNTAVTVKVLLHRSIDQVELAALVSLRYPRILLLLGVVRDATFREIYGSETALVTEYMPRGSLYDILHSVKTPQQHKLTTLYSKLRVLLDVADGIRFLHDSNKVYCDFRSSNVLLDEDGRAKIDHCGIRNTLNNEDNGTEAYKSPEVLLQPEYERNQSADVYSFGVIMWEVFTDKIPWEGLTGDQIVKKLSYGECLPIPNILPYKVTMMMEQCLRVNPDERPLFSDIFDSLRTLVDITGTNKKYNGEVSCPKQYLCPISLEIMVDPVICSDGYTYERKNIERWFAENDRSPYSNIPLLDKSLRSNFALRSMIDEYLASLS